MGLSQELQDEFTEAFDTDFADAVKEIVLVKQNSVYNTDSGKNVLSDIPDPLKEGHTRGLISSKFQKEERSGGAIKRGIFNAIIIVSELTLVPVIDDIIEDNLTKERYVIISFNKDPLGVLYNIEMEKRNG